jgi:hypothetical protein
MALVRGFRITHFFFFVTGEFLLMFNLPFPLRRRRKIYIKEDFFYFRGKKAASSKEKYIVNVDIVFISAMTRALREVEWALLNECSSCFKMTF